MRRQNQEGDKDQEVDKKPRSRQKSRRKKKSGRNKLHRNLSGPKNHATSWDKKSHVTSRYNQKSRNLSGQKKITQPLGTKNATSRDKKIMQPLG